VGGACDWIQSEKGVRLIMKMKKLVALGAAAAMSMAMCVNVFAEATSAGYNVDEETKAITSLKLINKETDLKESSKQYTVVVFKEGKREDGTIISASNLQAGEIEYINQGLASEEFWTDMRTKNVISDGTYVVRVGGETGAVTAESGVYEYNVVVSTTPDGRISVEFKCCDINGDGNVTLSDITNLISAYLGGTTEFTNSTTQDVFTYNSSTIKGTDGTYTFSNGYKWCDINGDGAVNLTDVTNLISAYLGGNKDFSGSKFGTTYTYNESIITMSITK